MSDHLLIDQQDGLVHVRLNRPQALNALSPDMIHGLLPILLGDVPVLVTGEGRAFCSGGDVKSVWHEVKAGRKVDYFDGEYHVNAALYARDNAYVSYLNGITMGGGYGISAHGSHIIVCEDTKFAMPEVKIGFFPDVGAAYPLSRAPHALGFYLGVTGNTIGADDMIFAGLADAYVPKARFEDFKAIMAKDGVEAAIEACASAPEVKGIFRDHFALIETAFSQMSVEGIIEVLRDNGSAFALSTLADMLTRSPLSMKVALRHLQMAKDDDFEAVIARDGRIARVFMDSHDFIEGVRAALIDKDNAPSWVPDNLAGVDGDMLALYFGADGG